mmetsp:Transcript_26608/g.64669  ORF Transcript_26608/g.64669 Transcript_26608/m.64669 type:complete len:82 (-) Transcript_26608:1626-1871(-)
MPLVLARVPDMVPALSPESDRGGPLRWKLPWRRWEPVAAALATLRYARHHSTIMGPSLRCERAQGRSYQQTLRYIPSTALR